MRKPIPSMSINIDRFWTKKNFGLDEKYQSEVHQDQIAVSVVPGFWAEDEVAALPDDLWGDLRVDGHVAHAEEEAACRGAIQWTF